MTEVMAPTAQERTEFRIETDIVASKVPALRVRIKAFLAGGITDLTLSLSGVQMVDSAGIGLLIATHNSLRKVGGTLELTGVTPEIGELFRSMRMHHHFRISGAE